jgi:hypothetical protein
MISPSFYNVENLGRARTAQIAAIVMTVVVSGFLITTTAMSTRAVWRAEQELRRQKAESVRLSREAAAMRRESETPEISDEGGLETLAVRFASWAVARGVVVESLVPEGPPSPNEVKVGTVKLGTWNLSKVRIKGQGGFPELLGLLEELRNPKMPVKLESFQIQTVEDNRQSGVGFDLLLTVYEKKERKS